jgi:hypothetical protein
MGQILSSDQWQAPRNAAECFYPEHLKLNSRLSWNSHGAISGAKKYIYENLRKQTEFVSREAMDSNLVIFSTGQLTYQLLQILRPSIERDLTAYLTEDHNSIPKELSFYARETLKTSLLYPSLYMGTAIMCYLDQDQKARFIEEFTKPNATQQIDERLSELLDLIITSSKPKNISSLDIKHQTLIQVRELVYKFNTRGIYSVYVAKKSLVAQLDILPDIDEHYQRLYQLVDELKDCLVSEKIAYKQLGPYATYADRELNEQAKTAELVLYLPLTARQLDQIVSYDEIMQASKTRRIMQIVNRENSTAVVPELGAKHGYESASRKAQQDEPSDEEQEGQPNYEQHAEIKEEGAI